MNNSNPNERLKRDWSQNIFYFFVSISIIVIISPFLLKFRIFQNVGDFLLWGLGEYKKEYINLIGGMIGAGLAVSSAVLIQRRSNLQKENEEEQLKRNEIIRKSKQVKRYLERNIIAIWNIWLWNTFDMSHHFRDRKEFPYEPYSISIHKMLDTFIEIEQYLDESTIDFFYDIYFFSDKIHSYVNTYNSIKNETVHHHTQNASFGNVSINAEFRKTPSSYNMIRTLELLLERKAGILFNLSDLNFKTAREGERSIHQKKYSFYDQKEELARTLYFEEKKYIEDGIYIDLSKEKATIDEWMNTENRELIPNEHRTKIIDLCAAKLEFENIHSEYEDQKKFYFENMDTPQYSTKILALFDTLTNI